MSNSFDQERRDLRRTRWIKPGVWHPADRFSREALRRRRQSLSPLPVQIATGAVTADQITASAITPSRRLAPGRPLQPGIPASKLIEQAQAPEPEPAALDVKVDATPPAPEPEGDALTPQQKLAARRARQNEKRKLERAAAKNQGGS